MFNHEEFDGHERVVHIHDKPSGLKAIIAIHSTTLGPAGGGCRLMSYDSPASALTDALRLSKAMSYKNALAGLAMGGGKAVVLGPVLDDDRETVFRAFGRFVQSLSGAYVTAEDVGVTVEDMRAVAAQTTFVSGLGASAGHAGGDPSPYTARGVRRGIEAIAEQILGRPDLDGLTVAIQGLGHVGTNLCRELAERGAKLLVCDIKVRRVEVACDSFGAEPAKVDDVLFADVDIVSPCALGGAITLDVARKMRARAVAGAANNQLAASRAGQILFDRGIAYAPDYLINAGGMIMVAAEYFGMNDRDTVEAAVTAIYERTHDVLRRSRQSGVPTALVADRMAQDIIDAAAKPAGPSRCSVPPVARKA